jgi:acetyl esterase
MTRRPYAPALPPAVRWEKRLLRGTPLIPVRVYCPVRSNPANGGWLVWAHGGSWQHGSAAAWHLVTYRLAALSGWRVVSVDYRLAPRHHHPAALEDVVTALDWSRQEAGGLPVVAGGDSAGGTLAACAALVARDRGQRLAAQVLAYPPLDPSCAAPSYLRHPAAFPQAPALRRAWRNWRGTTPTTYADDGTPLHSSPFDASNLSGMAPAVLAVGGNDPVRDDSTEYADRLRAAHVPVRLVQLPGVGHADLLDPAGRFLPLLADALHHLPIDRKDTTS